jgi:hypothetical protein
VIKILIGVCTLCCGVTAVLLDVFDVVCSDVELSADTDELLVCTAVDDDCCDDVEGVPVTTTGLMCGGGGLISITDADFLDDDDWTCGLSTELDTTPWDLSYGCMRTKPKQKTVTKTSGRATRIS